jgi:hypothetical protein
MSFSLSSAFELGLGTEKRRKKKQKKKQKRTVNKLLDQYEVNPGEDRYVNRYFRMIFLSKLNKDMLFINPRKP